MTKRWAYTRFTENEETGLSNLLDKADIITKANTERLVSKFLNESVSLRYDNLPTSIQSSFNASSTYNIAETFTLTEVVRQGLLGQADKALVLTTDDFKANGEIELRAFALPPKNIENFVGLYTYNQIKNDYNGANFDDVNPLRIVSLQKYKDLQSLKEIQKLITEDLIRVQHYARASSILTPKTKDLAEGRIGVDQQKKTNALFNKLASLLGAKTLQPAVLVADNLESNGFITTPIGEVKVSSQYLLEWLANITGFPITFLAGTGTTGLSNGNVDLFYTEKASKNFSNSYLLPILNRISVCFGEPANIGFGLNSSDLQAMVDTLTQISTLSYTMSSSEIEALKEFALGRSTYESIKNRALEILQENPTLNQPVTSNADSGNQNN